MGSRRCWKSREIYSDSAGGVTDGGSPGGGGGDAGRAAGGGQRFIGGLGICFTGLSLPEKGCQDSEELPRGLAPGCRAGGGFSGGRYGVVLGRARRFLEGFCCWKVRSLGGFVSPCGSSLSSAPLPAALLLPYPSLSSPLSPARGHSLGWGRRLGLGDTSGVRDGLLDLTWRPCLGPGDGV